MFQQRGSLKLGLYVMFQQRRSLKFGYNVRNVSAAWTPKIRLYMYVMFQ